VTGPRRVRVGQDATVIAAGPPPFQPFYVAHRAAVLRLLTGMVGPERAQDCYCRAWLAMLRAWPPAVNGSLDSWALAIAHRMALEELGRGGEQMGSAEHEVAGDHVLLECDPRQLWDAVRALQPGRRAASVMRAVLDLPQVQVEQVLERSEQTVAPLQPGSPEHLPDVPGGPAAAAPTWASLLEGADAAFVHAAGAAGLVEVATTTVESPVGPLQLAALDGALVRVAFDVEDHDIVLADLAVRLAPRIVPIEVPVLAQARSQLDAYFAGERGTFDLPLDAVLARGPFRRQVLDHLREIPVGQTRTYAEVAALAGRPSAVRAVGSGCATNPLPVVIACHRVLRSGGDLGGYLGGGSRKRWLLEHERLLAG
jgi:methylated-DNA-[protein]-cysteine S-methyltransferase